jgi:hypothetical protein
MLYKKAQTKGVQQYIFNWSQVCKLNILLNRKFLIINTLILAEGCDVSSWTTLAVHFRAELYSHKTIETNFSKVNI